VDAVSWVADVGRADGGKGEGGRAGGEGREGREGEGVEGGEGGEGGEEVLDLLLTPEEAQRLREWAGLLPPRKQWPGR